MVVVVMVVLEPTREEMAVGLFVRVSVDMTFTSYLYSIHSFRKLIKD